jgi:GntR family transcriptional regulator
MEYHMSAIEHAWNENQPIYRQLRERLSDMIIDGVIAEGAAMPSVRTISLELKINPITVSRAVQELEEQGVLEKRRGLGMFVRAGARDKLQSVERDKFLQEQWPQLRQKIQRLELDLAQLMQSTSHQGERS